MEWETNDELARSSMRLWLIVKWLCKCTTNSWGRPNQSSQLERYMRSNIKNVYNEYIDTQKMIIFFGFMLTLVGFVFCVILCVYVCLLKQTENSTTIANLTNGVSVLHILTHTHFIFKHVPINSLAKTKMDKLSSVCLQNFDGPLVNNAAWINLFIYSFFATSHFSRSLSLSPTFSLDLFSIEFCFAFTLTLFNLNYKWLVGGTVAGQL